MITPRAAGRIAQDQIGAETGTGLWAGQTWEGFDMSDYLSAVPNALARAAAAAWAGAKVALLSPGPWRAGDVATLAALDAAAVRVRPCSPAIRSARHGGLARKEWD